MLNPILVLGLAAESATDPRTVAKYLRGETVRPLTRRRIESALAARGLPCHDSSPPLLKAS